MSRFFRTASTDLLTRERRQHLEVMAEDMLAFAQAEAEPYDFAVDIITSDEMLHEDWENERRCAATDAFDEGGEGRLDLLGMIFQEGVDLDKIEDFYGFDQMRLAEDVAMNGLHSLHFRCEFPSLADRRFYTKLISDNVRDIHGFPLDTLSCSMQEDAEGLVNGYDYISESSPDYQELSKEQIYTLFRLDSRKAPKWTLESFHAAIDHYLDPPESTFAQLLEEGEQNGLPSIAAVQRIEKAFMHLVYNMGYRLKDMDYDNISILDEVSPTIDYLISKVTQDKEFSEALKRQVLINLFSAFTAGLKLLDAKPEELQGIVLDKALIGHPLSQAFASTLKGPMHLFSSSDETTSTFHIVTPMIRYFKEMGYGISFDTSIHGSLDGRIQSNVLLQSTHPLKMIEERGAEMLRNYEGAFRLSRVAELMLSTQVLEQYDDQTVVSLLSAGLAKIDSTFYNEKRIAGSTGFTPLKPLFDARPHLKALVLDEMVDQQKVTSKLFDVFGFGVKELRQLGPRAPASFRDAYMAADLGL
ncbi:MULTISPECIES: hypothetical protein [Pseudomonas]|uniref:hypothetical protein n=1 Tax=Pseudomonas TaxID=286 RepID=UPI000F028944|nr:MULTISPECIES: hypothetical protein [Pseudomonas]MBD8615550.1 hypothetical protein [Pseudomonas putida]MBD8681798.1 hypothetical protein [Pseudomonas sp. CFBP 13719]